MAEGNNTGKPRTVGCKKVTNAEMTALRAAWREANVAGEPVANTFSEYLKRRGICQN